MSSFPLPLTVLPQADRDVHEIAGYLAKSSGTAAARFYEAVDDTYVNIAAAPLRWPIYPFGGRRSRGIDPRLLDLRKRAVIGFGTRLIFYRILSDQVQIFRVIHGARNLKKRLVETE